MNPCLKRVITIIGVIYLSFTRCLLADYYTQDFTSYYVGEKLTPTNDSLRFYFSIPDSGAVLAGFVLSSDTDWQECDNESAVLDICVDQNDSTRQVVITYMGRKKFEYPRYLWELGGGDHYIDIIFNPLKSAPNAEFVKIDSIKIALVQPDNPYYYPCLLIPYLNTYKIYSKDDIPLIVYYADPDQTPIRRYYNHIIFSHDTGHLGEPGANQDYDQFWSDRASSLDVEWYWDVTIDVSNDSMEILENYFQGTSHSKTNYSFSYRNYHPTLKVASSNNNFAYGFGVGEAKNRYPQLIPPLEASEYHAFYDSHPEIFEIWAKEIRRDYGMYDFDCRHEEAPAIFGNGYNHNPDNFYFTDPAYHMFFKYNISNNNGRDFGVYVKLIGDNKWYGRQVYGHIGQHWQSIVLPEFINLNDIDSLKISSSGDTGTEIHFDFTKIYFFDQDVNFISHTPNFPANQSLQNLEMEKTYVFKALLSNELTLYKLSITLREDSIHFELPISGDINENGIADLHIKEVTSRAYDKYAMQRQNGAFLFSLPYVDFDSVYDIMIRAQDVDGVSGYMPQFIEGMDFSVLTSIRSSKERLKSFSIKHNYPNPFNLSTTIEFEMQSKSYITMDVYNLQGQLIKKLGAGNLPAGYHRIDWDGTNSKGTHVGSGLYFISMRVGREIQTEKILLIK